MADSPADVVSKFVRTPLEDFVGSSLPTPVPPSPRKVLELFAMTVAREIVEIARDGKLEPLPAAADVVRIVMSVFAELGPTAVASVLAIPTSNTGIGSGIGAVVRALVSKHREQFATIVTTANSAIAAASVVKSTARWTPTRDEEALFARWLRDRDAVITPKTPRPKLTGATRLKKLLKLFDQGPIPLTEDVPRLKVRGLVAQALEQAGTMSPGPGWVVAAFRHDDPRPRDFGITVHAAVERLYRSQKPDNIVVLDARVHGPNRDVSLSEFENSDPKGDYTNFRLRIAYEAFQFYRGDDPEGPYDLRADIFDATTLELWEVKPLGIASMGAIQSWLYKARYNLGWAPYAAGQQDTAAGYLSFGRRWLAPTVIFLDRDHRAVALSSAVDGLIVYAVYRRVRKDEDEDQRVLDDVREVLSRWRWWEHPLVRIPLSEPELRPEVRPEADPMDLPGSSRGPGKGQDDKKPEAQPTPEPAKPGRLPEGRPANDDVEGERIAAAAKAAIAVAAIALLITLLLTLALALAAAAAAAALLLLASASVAFDANERTERGSLPPNSAARDAGVVREVLLAFGALRDVELARAREVPRV